MSNNIKWIAEYDFDDVPDGPLMAMGTILTVMVEIIILCFPWALWQFVALLPILGWAIIIYLFCTNSFRQLRHEDILMAEAYKTYLSLPDDLRRQLPTMSVDVISEFTRDEVRVYHDKIRDLRDEYQKQEAILRQPRHQQHLDEAETLIQQYRMSNKELA